MFRRLSFRLTASIIIILIIVTAIFVPIYIYTQKETYISFELDTMSGFYDDLKEISFTSEKYKIDAYISEKDIRNYTVVIADSMFNKVYSSSGAQDDTDIHYDRIAKHIEKFSGDAEPEYISKKNREEILLRKIEEQNGEIYYVYIRENVKSANSVLDYTNRNIVVILIGYTFVCAFALSIMLHSITKSIKKLSVVTENISKKDYSVRYDGKIFKDELGVLSSNINEMADTIQDNINSLNNYNFLLKEDLNYMAEYDKIRQSVISNITHELKTPLAIISSQIEMMNCLTDARKKEYYYSSAIEEIDKMSRLISRLLNYSVTEHNIFEDEVRKVDLSRIVRNLCEKSRNYVQSKGINFRTDIEDNCVLYMEENHLEHVFNNFLSNAIRHSGRDGKINIRLEKQDEKVRLSVFNKGNKIDERNKEKIWTNFFSSDKSTDDGNVHAGLGLFIVKEISILDHTDCGFINRSRGVEFWFDFVNKL